MADITIQEPETKSLTTGHGPVLNEANVIEIVDRESNSRGNLLLRELEGYKKLIEGKFGPAKKDAHNAHKRICALEAEALAPYATARRVLETRILAYQVAERKRAEEEARVKAEEQRKAEEDRKIQEAELAKKNGATDAQAMEILDEPIAEVAPAPEPEIPIDKGVGTTKRKKGDLISMPAFIRWLATQPITSPWFEQIEVAQGARDNAAKLYGKDLEKHIPGLRYREEEGMRVQRAF